MGFDRVRVPARGFRSQSEVHSFAKANSPTDHQWAKAFVGRERGLHAETAQSALTVVLKLVMGWSDQHHLDCFKYS